MDGPDSVWPVNTWLGQNQPGPEKKNNQQCWAIISLTQQHNWPGGNYSPLLLHAERYSFCMQEKKQPKRKQWGGRRVTWHGGDDALLVCLLRWRCCGGGRWQCHGSQTAAPSSGAAVSSGGEWDSSSLFLHFLSSSFIFQPLSSQFVFKFPTQFQAFPSSQFGFTNGSLLFGSFSLLGLFFFLSVSSPPACWRWASIYRAKGAGLIIVAYGELGSAGRLASGRGSPGSSSSKGVGLRVLSEHAGRERHGKIKEEKNKTFSFFPYCTSRGRRKRNSVV